MRTCKHLVEYLGKEYEDFRLKGVKKGNNKRESKASSKNIKST
jgi:hypothetical protein